MKMTLAAQLYQIIHNSGYGNQHDQHVRLKTFQQHVSKFQKLFEYCNENTKMCINIPIESVVSMSEVWGEPWPEEESSETPLSWPAALLHGDCHHHHRGVLCCSDLWCALQQEILLPSGVSPIWMQFLPSSAKIQISLHVVYYEACIASHPSAQQNLWFLTVWLWQCC